MFAKVSKKGQVTIPKVIREKLQIGSQGGVLFVLENDDVKLKGIPGSDATQLAGSLKKYAKSYVPLKKIREMVQSEIANDSAKEGLPD